MITTRWLAKPSSYEQTWKAMRDFTEARDIATPDQIWLVEHAPVYTLGQAGKAEHILNSADIPVVACDRGGQVTYHGPGQVTAYCLLELRRYHLYVKEYVMLLESVLLDLLHDLGLKGACTRPGAPGVYIHGAKIAALGIKVRNGCTYHGLALNVDMDLTPFEGINPCGYEGMPTTDLRSCGVSLSVLEAGDMLADRLSAAIIEYGQRKAQEHRHHDDRKSAATH